MDTAPWPQNIVLKPMEDILTSTNTATTAVYNNNNNNNTSDHLPNHANLNTTAAAADNKPPSSLQPSTPSERKVRPHKDQAINCPRCNSTNTKFCYYNNYSLAQPRYFCKGCRRYWTEGGSLRNIPVGGGSRKNKRSSPSPIIASSKIKLPDLVVPNSNPNSNNNNNNSSSTTANHGKIFHHESSHHHQADLNLGFPTSLSDFMNLPNIDTTTAAAADKNLNSSHMSALELLTGLTSSRASFNSFIPPPPPLQISSTSSASDPYTTTTGFSLLPDHHHHFKPTQLGFSLGNDGYGNVMQDGNHGMVGRMLFPFQDLNSNNNNNSTETAAAGRLSSTSTTTTTTSAVDGHHHHLNYSHDHQQIGKDEHHQQQQHQGSSTTGYWSGMLGGAGSW